MLSRILLTTDATVVRLLEACFDEPVRAAERDQHLRPAGAGDPDLETVEGETLLSRRVLLRGTRSGRNYVYGESLIVVDRLHPDLRAALLQTCEPIGRLLTVHRVETFREILRSGTRPAGELAGAFSLRGHDELLFRTYRMISGGRPVMRITESFPPLLTPAPDAVVTSDVGIGDDGDLHIDLCDDCPCL